MAMLANFAQLPGRNALRSDILIATKTCCRAPTSDFESFGLDC